MRDPYILYIQTFGKVQTGTKIEDKDYRRGSVLFNEQQTLAVALAADDAKKNITLRTRSSFEQELKRLQGK